MAGLALGCGRGPEPEAVPAVPEVAARAEPGAPVLLIGLDGADWELLDRYMERGVMPVLAGLVAEGSGGVLRSLHPPLSPLVWTTAVTGVSPLEHGILDFTRFDPASGLKTPIGSDARRVPAIWNMASAGGREVAVFGLWATYPAEAVNGLLVSDRLFGFLYQEESPPPGVVFPPAREPWARAALDASEAAVGLEALRAYLPWLGEAEYREHERAEEPYAHPVSALRRILVETDVYHRLATSWLAERAPDLTIVYLQGTDSAGHVFAPYAPPRQESISVEDFERYSRVPELYFRHVDRLLGDYRDLAEARGARLVLASDHGFLWDEGRPESLSSFAMATAAKWHRREGIYLLWGPGIAAAPGHPGTGEVAQVCATVLELLGLPAAAGTTAGPLPGTPSRASRRAVDYRKHYRPAAAVTVAGGEEAAARELAKLRALGYVGGSEPTRAPVDRDGEDPTRTAGSFNNAGLIWNDQGNREEARAAFERALELDPDLASALWNLSDLLFQQGVELERSDELLARALGRGLPEGLRFVIGRAIGYQRSGRPEASLRLLDLAMVERPGEPELLLFRGRYRVDAGDCRGALADFEQAQRADPGRAVAFSSSALARLCLGDRAGAARDFRRSLELDPDQPQVRDYLERIGL